MKPYQVILLIILALFLTIILVRSCQDDNDFVPSDSDSTEQPTSPGNVNPSLPDFNTPELPETPVVDNPSDWPDSVYYPTAAADFLSPEEKEVVIELNKCRTNPIRYSNEVLVPFLHSMSSYGTFVDSRGNNIRTKEGKAAVQEAINALNNQSPCAMLYPKEYLSLAAQDLCNDHGPQSLVGHGGTDGSTPTSRAKRHNPNARGVGENVAYGSFSPRDVMISLIVDDDVPSRGHRDNIFHNYSFVGIAFGAHKGYGIMCVQDFE